VVLITERACAELRRLLTYHQAQPRQGVRLRVNEAGSLKMTIDYPRIGDGQVRRDNLLLLILDGRVSSSLAGGILDFDQPDGKPTPEFSLRRP
jgi:hypothetical protein